MNVENLRIAGSVNLKAIEIAFANAKPGTPLVTLDAIIEKTILDHGCRPAFKNYKPDGYPLPFPASACISPNEVVVHGIPGDYVIEDGDLITIDVGTEYNGWFVDAARSRVIGKNNRAQKLVDATEKILEAQLSMIKNGCNLLDIVLAAENEALKYNVTILPQWGGHGIGQKIHMDPFIPNAISNKSPLQRAIQENQYKKQYLKSGQIICLEPVTSFGDSSIIIDDDQWTVRKKDGELAAHTERCIIVMENGYELLS